ncbi:MAG: DUF2909 family protein [Methylococcales bacterium]|nr:DUF2909 family protein [Methylococcales bacterium]
MIKLLFLAVFMLILVSLGVALKNIIWPKDQHHAQKAFKALTWRIGMSLVLFVLLFLAVLSGLIQPQGIGARIEQVRQGGGVQAPR